MVKTIPRRSVVKYYRFI